MAAASLLTVLEDCEDIFHKDEGGKNRHLSVTVGMASGSVPCRSVPLLVDLYFESETRVEESDQSILNLLKSDYESYSLTPGEPSVTINFRLEKVSRRKDGQRFKLHVAPDLEGMRAEDVRVLAAAGGEGTDAALGVFSTAVVVMSKRRTGERFVSRPRPARAGDGGAVPAAVVEMLNSMSRQLSTLQASTDALVALVHKEDSRLAALETAVYGLARAPHTLSGMGGGMGGGMAAGMPPPGQGQGWGGQPPPVRLASGDSLRNALPASGQFAGTLPAGGGGTGVRHGGGLQGVSLAGGVRQGPALTTATAPAGLPAAAPGGLGSSAVAGGVKRIRSADMQFSFGLAGAGGGEGESTEAPPLPGGVLPVAGAPGVPRMTSLDHMFSGVTAGSLGLAMGQDERMAVEALAGASASAPLPVPVPAPAGAGAGAGGGRPKRARR